MVDLNSLYKKHIKELEHKSHGGEIYNDGFKIDRKYLLDYSTNINPFFKPSLFNDDYEEILTLINKYPDSDSLELKKVLTHYFNDVITADNILIDAGSMETIALFCDMFVKERDEVIIVQPTFSEYEWAVKKNNGKVINVYRSKNEDFGINSHEISENISSKTKIIFICNPNNPNGNLDNPEEMLNILKNSMKNNILVFLDEAFIEFAGEANSFVSKINDFNNLFISRSFTKFFGLPGLRIGFGIANADIISYLRNGQALWSVNCFAQEFAKKLLLNEDFTTQTLDLIENERCFLLRSLEQHSELKIYPSKVNYLLVNSRKTGITARELKKELLKKGILIRDCSNYKGLDEFYFRISIQDRKSNERLMESLNSVLMSLDK